MALFWFLIGIAIFIIDHIYIIVLKYYPGWLSSQACQPSMGYLSFVQEDPPDLSSGGLGRCCCCCGVHLYVCGTVFRCGAVSLSCWASHACLGLGDLLSLDGLSKKSETSIMSSSVSGSRSSKVLAFLGWEELALGGVTKFLATLASHDVVLFSFISSSKLRFLREGGVIDSIGGIFSLSELKQSGSSKNLGLYLCSVGLGHGPESEVILLSFFCGVDTLEVFGEPVSCL